MLDDVAVPDIEARQIEPHLDSGDLVRVGDYGILESCLPGLRSLCAVGTSAQDLELYQVIESGGRPR